MLKTDSRYHTGIYQICIAVLLVICLAGGCAKQNPEEIKGNEEQTETMENTVSNTAQLDEEIFAHGISEETDVSPADASADTSDASDAVGSAADVEENAAADIENIIEEKCPDDIASVRPGVSYPEAEHITYYSETCMMERGANVLLPADYDENKQYPVFYVLHGIFGDENSFAFDSGNRIKEIVTNMARDGRIPSPIIVFPNMYATSDPEQRPGFDAEACEPYDNFVNDLVNDLMPYMEQNYSILTDRENTWLAGFSMGGRETLYITLCHPEKFGYVCAVSPAPGLVPGKDMFMTHPGTLTEDEVRFDGSAILPNVLMVCCGTRDSVVGRFPLSYHELFDANGVDHIWYEITGADHDNNAIKSGIYNLMKKIETIQKAHYAEGFPARLLWPHPCPHALQLKM